MSIGSDEEEVGLAIALQRVRLRLAVGGMVGIGLVELAVVLADSHLPEDYRYGLLLQLMWAGNEALSAIAGLALQSMFVVSLLFAATLLIAAAAPNGLLCRALEGQALRQLWTYSLVPPVLFITGTSLGRLSATAIYSLDRLSVWSFTPLLARTEGGIIQLMQSGVPIAQGRPLSIMYSAIWIVALLLAAPAFGFYRDPHAVDEAVIGPVLLTLLAIPIYVLFPVHDPWSLNPQYGFVATVPLTVRYLNPGVDTELLRTVAVSARRVVGSCLPSLHVALPAYFALLAWKHRFVALAAFFSVLTMLTWITVVILGRHWITDGIAAIGLAILGLAVVSRTGFRITRSGDGLGRCVAHSQTTA